MKVCYFIGEELYEDELKNVIDNKNYIRFGEYMINKGNIFEHQKTISCFYNKFIYYTKEEDFWKSNTYLYFLPKNVIIKNKDKIKYWRHLFQRNTYRYHKRNSRYFALGYSHPFI